MFCLPLLSESTSRVGFVWKLYCIVLLYHRKKDILPSLCLCCALLPKLLSSTVLSVRTCKYVQAGSSTWTLWGNLAHLLTYSLPQSSLTAWGSETSTTIIPIMYPQATDPVVATYLLTLPTVHQEIYQLTKVILLYLFTYLPFPQQRKA